MIRFGAWRTVLSIEALYRLTIAVLLWRSRRNVIGNPAFQLPTFSLAIMNPISMSVRRDMPRHMTRLPGGPSPARFK